MQIELKLSNEGIAELDNKIWNLELTDKLFFEIYLGIIAYIGEVAIKNKSYKWEMKQINHATWLPLIRSKVTNEVFDIAHELNESYYSDYGYTLTPIMIYEHIK